MYHVSALLVEDSVLVYQTEGAIFFCLHFVILTITKAYHIIYLTRQPEGVRSPVPVKI